MYGQYHIPRGKNPALSCLIGFVSMDRAKQQNYSTIYSTSDSSLGRRVVYSFVIRVERSLSLIFLSLSPTCGASSYRVHVPYRNTVQSSRGEAPQSWRRVVMSNEASNHKAAPFPQLSWRDEVIMLKKEVGGTKQPSFHLLLNLLLPHLLQVNHVLLLSLFCLMWDADRLGKALTCGTAC